MSSEPRRDDPPHPTPVYTVYPVPGGNQGNLNYGFHHQPYHQAPPPKYEDVISGEYLNWKEEDRQPPPPPSSQPATATCSTCHCTSLHAHTTSTQPLSPCTEPPPGKQEEGDNATMWICLSVLMVVGVLIWRISCAVK